MGIRAQPQHLTITGALALALCLLALLAAGPEQAHAQVAEDYRADEVIVKLDPNVVDLGIIDATINDINTTYGTATLDDSLKDRHVVLLEIPENQDLLEFANVLENDPWRPPTQADRVLYAEPNFVTEAPEDPAYEDPTTGVARFRARGINDRKQHSEANDTFAENLNLSSCARDIEGTTVAVVDTGAQLDHPALRGNFRGVKGYDFVDNDAKPSEGRARRDKDGDGLKNELRGHGTHVAGIVDQVAPGAKIMPLRVLNPEGYGDVYTVARAIAYAQDQDYDVNVINLSLSTSRYSKLLREMIAEATGNNIVVAAAAGNSEPEGTETPQYPAAGGGLTASPGDGLLGVTSVDGGEIKSSFANYGLWVDIAAPGENIRSTFPRGRYAN